MTSTQSYLEIVKTPVIAGVIGYGVSKWAFGNSGTVPVPVFGNVNTNIAIGVITALSSLANKLSKNFILGFIPASYAGWAVKGNDFIGPLLTSAFIWGFQMGNAPIMESLVEGVVSQVGADYINQKFLSNF
jgi:hypothetical protein